MGVITEGTEDREGVGRGMRIKRAKITITTDKNMMRGFWRTVCRAENIVVVKWIFR